MRWSWKTVRTWLPRRAPRPAADGAARPTPHAPAPPPLRGSTAWRRLPVLRTTVRVSPWTVAATARTATAKAGTRSLVHQAPAPALPGTAPRGRVDSLVGTPAVVADVPAVHPVSRRPRTPGHTGAAPDAAVGTPVEPDAEEGPSMVSAAPRRVPVIAPRPATGPDSSGSSTLSGSVGAGRDPGTAPLPLTRAVDAYVGEPRPVTPPPARSEFDLQLDAFRPAWIVAQLENAGGDLPSYVLARREKGPQSATAPDPQPLVPPTPAPVLPPAVPGAPRASLAESRRRDLAHRSRRHPDAYRRQAADGTVQEDDATLLPTATVSEAPESPDTPEGPVSPEAHETPAGTEVPETSATSEVTVPSGTPSAQDAGTDTSVTVSPGWEAEWSRKQAARHGFRNIPRDAAPHASEHAAETPASGHTGRGLPSGPAPSAAPESDAPTEDDTVGTPMPGPATVPVLLDGAAGPRGVRDPFRPSVTTPNDVRGAAVPSSPALPELAHRTAAPRPATGQEHRGPATNPPTSQHAPSTGETSSGPTTANGAPPSPTPAPAPAPEGTMSSGAATAPDPAQASGGTPAQPRPSTSTAARPSGIVASANPVTSVAPPLPDSPVTPRDAGEAGDAATSPLPVEATGEPATARSAVPGPVADQAPGPEAEAALSSGHAPVAGPVARPAADSAAGPTSADATTIAVVPRAVPSSVPPASFRTTEAPGTDRPRTAYRAPATRPALPLPSPLPGTLRRDPARSSHEGHSLLVHRHPASGANVLILEQVPDPALPDASPNPAAGVALPLVSTPTTAPGIPAALAAAVRTSTAGLPSADAAIEGATGRAAGHGAEPARDASGAPLLRLVPPVSPTEGPATAAPVTAGTARTRPVLYAVPQYVAPLIAATRPGAAVLSGPATPDGAEAWTPDSDEPEAVSAEAMALAVHRAAVGSELVPVADAPSLPGPGAQARAATRWFGDTASLHHVRAQQPQITPAGTLTERSDGRVASASVAPPEASAVPPYEESGGGEQREQPSVTYSSDGGHLTPPGGGGFSFGGPPPAGPARDPGVPLEQTPAWAALMDMLADRDRIYARFDDPAVLDALAARLYDRILAHVRQELVVERERHGLLAPRS